MRGEILDWNDNWTEEEEEEFIDEEEQQLLNKLKTVKERVEFILRKYPKARNSCFYTIIMYIRHFAKDLSPYIGYIPDDLIFKYEGLFESIRRARQIIQNTEGKYPPTNPYILMKRRRRADKFRRAVKKV